MKCFIVCAILAALLCLPACGSAGSPPKTTAAPEIVTELPGEAPTESETVMDSSATSKAPPITTTAATPVPGRSLEFAVGFQINTHGYTEGAARAVLIRSRKALDAFYANDTDGNKHHYQGSLAKYGDAFFRDKALLLLVRQEPSGSNSLRVEGVALSGGVLEARVARSLPGVGTMDMARWVVGIELDAGALPAGEVRARAVYG